GAADSLFLNWFYLNGSKTPPASGLTSATVPVPMPGSPGTYEFRFFQNNGYTRLATSPTVTVTGGASSLTVNGSSSPVTVAAGSSVTVGVLNGPGHSFPSRRSSDLGAADSLFLNWFYLNGSKTP